MLMRSELGTLATGKTADIIAVPGNPFGNITMMENVSFFTKAGTVCKSWFHSGTGYFGSVEMLKYVLTISDYSLIFQRSRGYAPPLRRPRLG